MRYSKTSTIRIGKKSHASNTSGPVIFTIFLNTMLYLYNIVLLLLLLLLLQYHFSGLSQ